MKFFIVASITTILVIASAPSLAKDNILSLSNLERERASLINLMLDPTVDFEDRLVQINKRQRQLSDMERMVIRDERLIGSQNHIVKQAFKRYELTFLVHAGAENEKNAASQWLDQIQFNSASVLQASAGYR